tara:strand:+ start:193 stop:345 length:153 start_codon:yes stop_codon:yes gene_type:complete
VKVPFLVFLAEQIGYFISDVDQNNCQGFSFGYIEVIKIIQKVSAYEENIN